MSTTACCMEGEGESELVKSIPKPAGRRQEKAWRYCEAWWTVVMVDERDESTRRGTIKPRRRAPRIQTQTPKDLDVDLSLSLHLRCALLDNCDTAHTNLCSSRSRSTPGLSLVSIYGKSQPPFYLFTAAYTMPPHPLTRNIVHLAHSSHFAARTPDRVAAVSVMYVLFALLYTRQCQIQMPTRVSVSAVIRRTPIIPRHPW